MRPPRPLSAILLALIPTACSGTEAEHDEASQEPPFCAPVEQECGAQSSDSSGTVARQVQCWQGGQLVRERSQILASYRDEQTWSLRGSEITAEQTIFGEGNRVSMRSKTVWKLEPDRLVEEWWRLEPDTMVAQMTYRPESADQTAVTEHHYPPDDTTDERWTRRTQGSVSTTERYGVSVLPDGTRSEVLHARWVDTLRPGTRQIQHTEVERFAAFEPWGAGRETTTITYDDRGRVARAETTRKDAAGRDVPGATLTYEWAGNVLTFVRRSPEFSVGLRLTFETDDITEIQRSLVSMERDDDFDGTYETRTDFDGCFVVDRSDLVPLMGSMMPDGRLSEIADDPLQPRRSDGSSAMRGTVWRRTW